MKSTSKVIMAATLVMLVTVAVVLGLVLVLLAELYCSFLLRRRRQLRLPTTTNSNSTTNTTVPTPTTDPSSSHQSQETTRSQSSASLLTSFYSQGVLQAPRSLLFPSVPSSEVTNADTETQLSKLHQVLEIHHAKEPNTIPRTEPASPELIRELQIQPIITNTINNKPTSYAGTGEHFVYISNPIYSNEAASKPDTPFETPDSSPSRLETCGCSGSSSGDDDDEETGSGSPVTTTPPLTPMKKLPEKACSISLRDSSLLGTSGSDSNSNNGGSSSSSGSPRTSPSW